MRILVTSGGTREPIDSVRYITNLSTGRTGSVIAEALARSGHEIFYLHAESAVKPAMVMEARTFRTYEDIELATRECLKEFKPALVIQAAAISDFKVESQGSAKIPSGQEITLKLSPRAKIVSQLKKWAGYPLVVVAFKLTDGGDPTEKIQTLARGEVDWIVHNDLRDRSNDKAHSFSIYSAKPSLVRTAQASDALELAVWFATQFKGERV